MYSARYRIPEEPTLNLDGWGAHRKLQSQLDALRKIASAEEHQQDREKLSTVVDRLEKLRDALSSSRRSSAMLAARLDIAAEEAQATDNQAEQVLIRAGEQIREHGAELEAKNKLVEELKEIEEMNRFLDKKVDQDSRRMERLLGEVAELQSELAIRAAMRKGDI